MIDVHCHLEQEDFDKDRNGVIEKCRAELKAVITCCAKPSDLELTMEMVEKNSGFVFASVGMHPIYIKETSEAEKDAFMDKIKENRKNIVSIGETGLDFYWVREKEFQDKQKTLFREMISFANELKLPLLVHSRDAMEETIKILEDSNAKNVLMHLFGSRQHLQRVADNGWHISMGPIITASKNHRKIARDFPIERIMLETDSPWFGFGKRGEPLNIKKVAEKIAEARKISFDEVWKRCGQNAVGFFDLPLRI